MGVTPRSYTKVKGGVNTEELKKKKEEDMERWDEMKNKEGRQMAFPEYPLP